MIARARRRGGKEDPDLQSAGLRIAPRAQAWFATTQRASVLHRGRSALYLENPEQQIVGIVTPAVGAGPLFLTLADEGMLSRLLSDPPIERDTDLRGLQVAVTAHRISWLDRPEGMTPPLNVERALPWNPRPHWSGATASDWSVLASWARPEISPTLVTPLENLTRNWRQDPSSAAEAALYLAGRGDGLTPAGDDLLIGFALGLWATGDPSTDRLRELLSGVAPRTTRLSAAHLAAAAEGEAPEAWHHLVDALSTSPRNLDSHRTAILGWGASSGRHTLYAFLTTLGLGFDSPRSRSTHLPMELSA
ncbi:MAG: DUF2877 domain-containing protein [Thermoanaerobaculia bacterium]|nr:DUF2877 domain-containing protein [Thermoanaerobaculia bacterium]